MSEAEWGTREEKLKWVTLHMIRNYMSQMHQALCTDKKIIQDIMKIHEALLDKEELDTLVNTCTQSYMEKIEDIKLDVAICLSMEADKFKKRKKNS